MKKIFLPLVLLFVFLACNDEEEEVHYEFHYSNATAYPVHIIVYGEGISSFNGSTCDTIALTAHVEAAAMISSRCMGDFCKRNAEPFEGLADSARIVFDGKREVFLLPEKDCSFNVLCQSAYKQSKEDGKQVLKYTVDDNLYELAREIR